MTGIDFIREYRKNSKKYLPLISHERNQFESRTEEGEVNIGWNCGFIGLRPYFYEVWAVDGITVLTIFISTNGIEEYTAKDIERMLIDEAQIYSKKDVYDEASVVKIGDINGNEFFSINVTVGVEDEPALIVGGAIYPYSLINELNGKTSYYTFPLNLILKRVEDIDGTRDYVFCDGKWERDDEAYESGEYGKAEPVGERKALRIVEDQLASMEDVGE